MDKTPEPKNIFLADDDTDDCILFEDALREVCGSSQLITANDGIELMDLLYEPGNHRPDVIFLDLNMPRKNGFECLTEIRGKADLKNIPIVIFSTTAQPDAVKNVYENGANCFVCKPNSFQQLKRAIQYVLSTDWTGEDVSLPREAFIYQP